MKFFLKNARHLGAPVDLLCEDGKIVTMTPAGKTPAPEDAQTEDAGGLVLLPGLTDCHVHLREPGFEWKEDIDTGAYSIVRRMSSVLVMGLPSLVMATQPASFSSPRRAISLLASPTLAAPTG